MNRFLSWIVAVGLLAVTAASATAKNPVVTIDTSMGTIKVELFEDKAPITVKNFLSYVDKKFYDGTVFHRVMPGFMIQGGGFEPGMRKRRLTHPSKMRPRTVYRTPGERLRWRAGRPLIARPPSSSLTSKTTHSWITAPTRGPQQATAYSAR